MAIFYFYSGDVSKLGPNCNSKLYITSKTLMWSNTEGDPVVMKISFLEYITLLLYSLSSGRRCNKQPLALIIFKGLVTKYTAVKWSIDKFS